MAKRNNTRRNNRRGGRRANGLFTRVGRIPTAGLKAVNGLTDKVLNVTVNIPTSALRNVKNIVKRVKHNGISGVNSLQKGVFSGANNILGGVVGVVRSRKNKKNSRRASRKSRKVGGRRRKNSRNNSRKNRKVGGRRRSRRASRRSRRM